MTSSPTVSPKELRAGSDTRHCAPRDEASRTGSVALPPKIDAKRSAAKWCARKSSSEGACAKPKKSPAMVAGIGARRPRGTNRTSDSSCGWRSPVGVSHAHCEPSMRLTKMR